MTPRTDGFDITAASEIMAIFCLAKDIQDLQRRLGNIVIGYNKKEKLYEPKNFVQKARWQCF